MSLAALVRNWLAQPFHDPVVIPSRLKFPPDPDLERAIAAACQDEFYLENRAPLIERRLVESQPDTFPERRPFDDEEFF